jgi:hypothetical protein
MKALLQPGDLLLTRGSSWIGRAIRAFETQPREGQTFANHVGVVVEGGSVDTAVIVEALWTVERHPLAVYKGSGDWISVARMPRITLKEQQTLADKAAEYVGRKYGWLKIGAHAGDRLIERLTFGLWKNPRVFRAFALIDKYPICSWVVAFAYDAIGVRFGVEPNAADPDDIDDFQNLMAWETVIPWSKL